MVSYQHHHYMAVFLFSNSLISTTKHKCNHRTRCVSILWEQKKKSTSTIANRIKRSSCQCVNSLCMWMKNERNGKVAVNKYECDFVWFRQKRISHQNSSKSDGKKSRRLHTEFEMSSLHEIHTNIVQHHDILTIQKILPTLTLSLSCSQTRLAVCRR